MDWIFEEINLHHQAPGAKWSTQFITWTVEVVEAITCMIVDGYPHAKIIPI